MYNKNTYLKTNDKKILHKSGKQWVTVSIAMLALLGGGAVASRTTTHAATTQGATAVQVKNRMNDALANNNQAQQPSNNKPTTQNITNKASTLHSALLKQGVDQGSNLKKFSPESVERSKPTSAESSVTSSSADSKSVASGSSSASASSNSDATNTYVIPKNNRGWDYVQDGVKDQVPNSGSSSKSGSSATSGSASNNSASAKPSFNSAYQSYEAQMGSEDATIASMNDKNANESNNNANKAVKPVLKDNATNYFSGGVTKTGNDDGLNYRVYANGGLEFTGGTPKNNLMNFTGINSDVSNAYAIKFDNQINTSNVTNMSDMFSFASNLQTLTLPNSFDTSNVTDMTMMFGQDSSLQSLTLPKSFNTSKVTSMGNMFSGDSNLQSLTLPSDFDTSKVSNMQSMFGNDTNLQSLTLPSDFDTRKAFQNSGGMFSSDTSLQSLTIKSPNTKLDALHAPMEYPSDVGLPHMYKETGLTDNNGKPLTLYASDDFTQGNVGTFTTNRNAVPITFSDIYQSTDDNPNVDMTGYTLPNAYAYVDAQGKISQTPVKDSKGHVMVAPTFSGVTYKYDKANNAVEFVNGVLGSSDNNSNDSIIQQAKSIKFDNSVDTSKVSNKGYIIDNDRNLKSLILSDEFDTRNSTSAYGTKSDIVMYDPNLSTIVIQSPYTILGNDTKDAVDLLGTQSNPQNGKTNVVKLNDGKAHIGTWTLSKQNYDGMAYKYNKADNSVEFIGGSMRGGNYFLLGAPSDVQNASSIKFDSDVDMSQVSDMSSMFTGDADAPNSSLKSVIFSKNCDVSNVKNMSSMFRNDQALQTIVMPSLKDPRAKNVDMSTMFQSDYDLSSLTLPSNFDTHNVTNMTQMFQSDFNLTSLSLPESFDTSSVTDMDGMFYNDKELQSLNLPESFNTSNVSGMNSMFANNTQLQYLGLPSNFDTHKVNNMYLMFESDNNLRAIDINSANTRFKSDAFIPPHTNVAQNYLGIWLGAQPSNQHVSLTDGGQHVGLYLNLYDPRVTDTIHFQNNGEDVGKPFTFSAREYGYHTLTSSEIPSGYQLVNPNNNKFTLKEPPYNVYNVPVKSAPVVKDTDYIHFEDANSKAVVEPTLQVTGNDKSNYNVQANQIPKNYKLATTNNGNGFVMNNGDHVVYVTRTNTDNGDRDIPISSNTVTFNGKLKLHFHNGNNDINDIYLPYSIATANNQTIKDLLNSTNPYAKIPADYLNKIINQFNTANFTYDNNINSDKYDNVVVDPNANGYVTGTNDDKFNNGLITLNFSPNNMNEKVNYSYNGKNEGSYTFNGPNDTKGSDTTGQGIKPGYHIAPNNPDNSWIYGNEGAHNDTDTVNVVPNNINGTATVHLVYEESDGNGKDTVDEKKDVQIPIHNQVGGKQIVDPWDYARDNYTQPNSDWSIPFPSDANETKYSPTHTFTYVAQTAPDLEIRYVDVDPNAKAIHNDNESTDSQGRPIISTNTYSGSKLQDKNNNIKWIVGNTVTIGDTNSSNPNTINLIQAPKGFHLDEHQQGFDYQNGLETITLEPNATDPQTHKPMILMSIGMFNPFSNHKKPVNPVKPASSTSAKPSSASVAPSSKASSASSSVAPSSKASTTPSSSSVAPSSESASVAPSSANNTVIYYNPTSVTNDSIVSAPSEASVASGSATPKSTSASTTTKVSTKKARPNKSAKLVPINHKIHKNIKKTNKVVANKPSKITRYKVVVKNGKPTLKTANITNRVASDNAPVKHTVVESVPDNQSFMMKVPNSNQKVQVQVNNANKLPQTGEATNNTLIASIIMLLASVVLAGVSIDRKHDND